MRGHDDLAILGMIHPPHQFQEFDLARRRRRRFRFVEDEDALSLTALFKESQKAFAVRMGEEIGPEAAGNAPESGDWRGLNISATEKSFLPGKTIPW
jgi:hypothetical protein